MNEHRKYIVKLLELKDKQVNVIEDKIQFDNAMRMILKHKFLYADLVDDINNLDYIYTNIMRDEIKRTDV